MMRLYDPRLAPASLSCWFIVLLLVLPLTLVGCIPTGTSTPPPPTVVSTPTPLSATIIPISSTLTLFETPRDGPTPVLSAIQNATTAVDVEVYELTDSGVIKALIADQQAGRSVRVILNQNFFGGTNVNTSAFQQLNAAGVAVQWADPTFTYTHEKAVIVDPEQSTQQVLIMTLNLSPGYLGEPDPQGMSLNFGVVNPFPADVAQAELIFNADWNHQSYTPPPNTDLVISPVNARADLLTEIQNATHSIHFFAQEFIDQQIVKAMVVKAQSGIEVKGLIAPGISGNPQSAAALQAAGGQVRILSQPYEHAKATIVDGSVVYLGSINYTQTSMDKNRELGVLTSQSDIAAQMEVEFTRFWTQGTAP